MSVVELDPGSQPAGITNKLVIDATTPVSPDDPGHCGQPMTDLPDTPKWVRELSDMLAAR
jgi:3-polyprenyl-4-hydroxybenzoate decarboxylase